jgi:hypothetical protein
MFSDMMPGMVIHPQTLTRALCVRLLPDGRVAPGDGGHYPPPATWQIKRCWRYGGVEECFVKATVGRRPYFANVKAALLTQIERSDGVLVRIERFAKR